MIFPSTGLLDDFNRADESPLSGGGTWDERALATVFTMSLLSNEAISQATQTTFATRRWIDGSAGFYGQDHEVYATLGGTWPGGSSFHVYSRVHGGSIATRKGYIAAALATGNDFQFLRYDGVSLTLLDSVTQAISPGDKIGLRSIGSNHYVYVYQGGSWQEIMLVNDSTWVGGTYDLGLGLGTQNPRADDFSGGNIHFPQIIRHRRRVAAGT